MNLRVAVDALLFKRARIVADVDAGALHIMVEMLTPPSAQIGGRHARQHLPAMFFGFAYIARAGGCADDLATGAMVGVLEQNMRVRIMRVLAAVVMRRAPGDATVSESVHETLDELVTLLGGEFDGQRDHEFVGDARALG